MTLDDFDFELPPERIAARPASRRDAARMLVLDRSTGARRHSTIAALPDELRAGDLLVVNDTRVRPARIAGRKPSGGRVEMLLVRPEPDGSDVWHVLIDVANPPQVGSTIALDGSLAAIVLERREDGWRVRLVPPAGSTLDDVLERHGRMPLPPYVRRSRDPGDDNAFDALDRERYQTIFAAHPGAVAAPTAGLHFTPALVAALERRRVEIARITLHVGPGTFLPVREGRIESHRMHEEWCELPDETAAALAAARARGGRVIAVGTTVARTLESCLDEHGRPAAGARWCSLFIRPGFRFRAVDGLLTNFHLPRSTLLMLVAGFAGLDAILAAYREAIVAGYRFYSYGDAMLIQDARSSR